MEKSVQTHQANSSAVSNLMDYEVTVCDTCGVAGREDLLAICNKCSDGAQHTYCMRFGVYLSKLPEGYWICEECSSECQKSESPVNPESQSSSKSKSRSSHAQKRQTEGTSSASLTSIKRPGVPSEAQSAENDRDIRMNDEPPRSNDRDVSRKFVKNGKAKATKSVTSEIQISSHPQDKAKVPRACGNKRDASTLEDRFDKKRRTLKKRPTSSRSSKPTLRFMRSGEYPLVNSRKEKLQDGDFVKQSSYGSRGIFKLPSPFDDGWPNLGSETEIVGDKCSLLKSGSSETVDLKYNGQLAKAGDMENREVDRNLAFHNLKNGKNTALVSKSVSFNRAASTGNLSAVRSEAVFLEPDCIWVGKLKIDRGDGAPFTQEGLQAQLSTRVSQKVREVAETLPDVIEVNELSRFRMWPETQATEDNIAIYFFAKNLHCYERYKKVVDHISRMNLALIGNLNDVELVIFPSWVLPTKSQRWNGRLFLWGLFRGDKINNSANTPLQDKRFMSRTFDLCPEDEEGIRETGEFDRNRASSSVAKDNNGREKNDADNDENPDTLTAMLSVSAGKGKK